MDWRLRLPGALYRMAVDRAGSDADLARIVRDYLGRYVDGTTAQQAGGRARAERLSPERRAEIARAAAQARWHREPPE